MQFGFMPGRGTIDAIFTFQQIQEKHQEKKVELYCSQLLLTLKRHTTECRETLCTGHSERGKSQKS